MRNSLSGLVTSGLTLVLLLGAASGAAADFSQRDWHYYKEINLPPGPLPDSLVELVPDREVFAGAAQGLADLRIISDADGEVPYKLEVSRAERQSMPFPVTLRDKGYVPGSYNVFTADLGRAGILHNEIEVRTPASDFRRTAIVETSNDEAVWMKIAEQTVYAFTVKERNFSTRNARIRYPESTARFLRVKIVDSGQGSLDVTGATVFYVKETPAREVSWPSTIMDISRDEEQRSTEVEIDLGTAGLPSYRLAVSPAGTNFFREVALEASQDGEKWTAVLRRAEIYAFDTPRFAGQSLAVTYPETAVRYLRLVIHDEDSPPLTIERVDVWGLWRRLVFVAEPQQVYRLYYGNAEVKQPSYDLERVFPYLATDSLPKAGLGPQAVNPAFIEKKPPLSERFPWLLPVVVAAAVIVVALLLLAILRQVRKILPPPGQ